MKYSFIILSFLFFTCQNPNEPEIFGCTNQNACNYNPNATISNEDTCEFPDSLQNCCLLIEQDDCGICGGEGIPETDCDCQGNILDECNICGGSGLNENDCCGEDTKDCLGECGGNAVEDCLGVCDGNAFIGCSDQCDNSVEDCFGVCGGQEVLDNCGVCGGDNSSCLDCENTINGDAVYDNCGVCDGLGCMNEFGSSIECGNDEGEYCDCQGNTLDCSGVCGGLLEYDDCNICGGPGLNSDGCCGEEEKDCNGDCDGDAILDTCGVCSGGNSEHVADSDIDCNGDCFGNAEFNTCGECAAEEECTCPSLDWEVIWIDDFENGSINLNNWNFEIWNPFNVNNEEQAYTASSNNAYIENGNLVITALRENIDLDSDGIPDTEYTSARLTTQNKFSTVYDNTCGECNGGKIKVEVDAKLPIGIGTWPAIWMMPNNSEYGGWPNSGEIDIMEHVGYEPNVIHSSVHNFTYSGDLEGTNQTNTQTISDVENNYHTYGLIWSDEEIITFINDESNTVLDYNNSSEFDYRLWPYDKEFFIILNLAIGGTWGGLQGIDDTAFPQSMYIDEVRVYKLSCQ